MKNLSTIFYNLPDLAVLNSEKEVDFIVWQPDKKYLVLGRSNTAHEALIAKTVDADAIPILKRHSGGEAVLLSSKMLVIAVKLPLSKLHKAHDAFPRVNAVIKHVLEKNGVLNLQTRGISDLSIGSMKILGSSIYKKDVSVFYHAVLNIAEDVTFIQKYIKHPKREPDYRKSRIHKKFVTSIHKEGYRIAVQKLSLELEKALGSVFLK